MPLFTKAKRDKRTSGTPVRADFILSTRIPPAGRTSSVVDESQGLEEFSGPQDGTFVRPDTRGQRRQGRKYPSGTIQSTVSATLRSDGSASSHGSSRGSTLSDDRILSRSFPTNESVNIIDNYSEPSDAKQQCSQSNSKNSLKSPESGSGFYIEPYDSKNTGNELSDFDLPYEIDDLIGETPQEAKIRPDYISIPGGVSEEEPVPHSMVTVKSEYTHIPESTDNMLKGHTGPSDDLRPSAEYEDPWELTSKLSKLNISSTPRSKFRTKESSTDVDKSVTPSTSSTLPVAAPRKELSSRPTEVQQSDNVQKESEPSQLQQYEVPWDLGKVEDKLKVRVSETNPSPKHQIKNQWRKSLDEGEILKMTEVPGLKHVDYGKKFPRKRDRKNVHSTIDGGNSSAESLEGWSSTSGSRESLDDLNNSHPLIRSPDEYVHLKNTERETSPLVVKEDVPCSHVIQMPTSQIYAPDIVQGLGDQNKVKVTQGQVTDVSHHYTERKEISCQTDETFSDILEDSQTFVDSYEEPLDVRKTEYENETRLSVIPVRNSPPLGEFNKAWLPEDQTDPIAGTADVVVETQLEKPLPCAMPNNDSGVGLEYEPPWDLGKQQQNLQDQLHGIKTHSEVIETRPPGEKSVTKPSRHSVKMSKPEGAKSKLRHGHGSSKNRKSYKHAVYGEDRKMYEHYDDDVLDETESRSGLSTSDTLPISLNGRNKKMQLDNNENIHDNNLKNQNTPGAANDIDMADIDMNPYCITFGKDRGVVSNVSPSGSSTSSATSSSSREKPPYKIPVIIPVQQDINKRPPQPTPRGIGSQDDIKPVAQPRVVPPISPDQRPLEDYDEPWDRKRHTKMIGKGKKMSREITSPVDDRPMTEYEAPWDQKQLLDRCADPFDGYEKPLQFNGRAYQLCAVSSSSPGLSSPNTSSRSGQNSTSSTANRSSKVPAQSHGRKHSDNSSRVLSSLGEPVDASIPLHKQRWYHGSVTRYEAEHLLRVHKDGSYLVRNSESNKDNFSLSLKSTSGFIHMKIQSKGHEFILGEFSQPFKSVPEMILYYTIHKLPIKGADHMVLQYPVQSELL